MADSSPPRASTLGLWAVIATALFLALQGEGLERILFLVTAILLYFQFANNQRIGELRESVAATRGDIGLLAGRVDKGEGQLKDTHARIALLEAEVRSLAEQIAEQVQDRRVIPQLPKSGSSQSWRFVGAMVAVLCTANVVLMGIVTFRYGVSSPLTPDGLSVPAQHEASIVGNTGHEAAPRARWKTNEMPDFVVGSP